MERAGKNKKKFNKSFLELLQQAQVMQNTLIVDLPQFTTPFPFINATYVSNFNNAINAADDLPLDDTLLGEQRMLTRAVAQHMQEACNAFTIMLTYVILAFPGRADVLAHFGKKKFVKARYNCLQLIELLRYAHAIANSADYKPMLISKGFLQNDINNLQATANTLDNTYALQQSAKINRSVMAQARVEKFNTLYNFMQEISSASKVVFMNNYAKQQQYKLYKKSTAANQQPDVVES
jgi:hypothetical protein